MTKKQQMIMTYLDMMEKLIILLNDLDRDYVYSLSWTSRKEGYLVDKKKEHEHVKKTSC